MSNEKAKLLLEKYQNGMANSGEQQRVEDWYAQLDAINRDLVADEKLAIREAMLQQLKVATSAQQAQILPFLSNWMKIAAAIFLAFSISISFWQLNHHDQSPIRIVATRAGEHKKIVLSDGSEISLSPLAKISYPIKFSAKFRKISLMEGEAFFAIAHDEHRPFQVKLPSNLSVAVLGTSFLIRAYRAKEQVEIAVSTGKVAIRHQAILLGTLVKNQQLAVNKTTGKTRLSMVSGVRPVAIEFSGATLSAVVKQIAYVYHVNILINEQSISNLKTTATFNSAQRPEEILDLICSLHHLRYSIDQNHQTFKIYQ